jgi:tetratricopeptide (TPR) repeat protein
MFLLALAAGLVVQAGCGGPPEGFQKITNRTADTSSQWSEDLFSFALENLNHLEDNDCEEMLRSTEQRLSFLKGEIEANRLSKAGSPEQRAAASQYLKIAAGRIPSDNLLASWPEPDMLRQVVSRLNQWVDTQEKPAEWTPDRMLASLPADLAKLPMVENLGQVHYTAYDGYMLMEAVWLRDASRSKWAGGGSADELQVARSLFDWTIRNIQTDYDSSRRVPQVPWETLFLGHGTPLERAWTYILLLRQRGIDAALLALPDEVSSRPLRPWCVGVLIGGKEKKLYLFDPNLCLPIPAPGGIVADKSGRLDVQPATLEQVVAKPELLDRLASDVPYWVQKADLKRGVVALIEASPLYVSPRAKRIESRLTGEQRLVLNAEPSPQAARFKAALEAAFKTAGVGDVRLWDLPYTTLQRRLALKREAVLQRLVAYLQFMCSPPAPTGTSPIVGPLYKGRVMHLKGRFFDEKEAIAYYQKARPGTDSVLEEAPKIAKTFLESHCAQYKANGGTVTPDAENFFKLLANQQAQDVVGAILAGKVAASYWLGLIQYEQGEFAAAKGEIDTARAEFAAAMDYFRVRTLQFGSRVFGATGASNNIGLPGNGERHAIENVFWATGAHYNIARTWEASGQRQKAIDEYETCILLRNDPGNLVRARWLKELDGEKTKKAEVKKPDEKKPEEKKIVEKKMEGQKAEEKKGK